MELFIFWNITGVLTKRDALRDILQKAVNRCGKIWLLWNWLSDNETHNNCKVVQNFSKSHASW